VSVSVLVTLDVERVLVVTEEVAKCTFVVKSLTEVYEVKVDVCVTLSVAVLVTVEATVT